MPVSLVVKVMMIISKVIEVMLVTHVVILAEVYMCLCLTNIVAEYY